MSAVFNDFDKESRYKGQIKQCMREGSGVYNFAHGANNMFTYEGTWVKGVRSSAQAKFAIDGYSQYSGEFHKGEMTGIGKRTWEDGRWYEGEFVDGEMHGKGKWVSGSGQEVYEGEFQDNKRHGFGTLQKGSDVYRGQFRFHKMDGRGVYMNGGMCVIEALFAKNIMNGPARIRWNKIGRLESNMVNGYAQGEGVYVADDNSVDYEGEWVAGMPTSSLIAKYIWSDFDDKIFTLPSSEPVDPKKKAAPPAKGKGKDEAPQIPLAIAGEKFSNVKIRTSAKPMPPRVAASNAAAGVGAKGKATKAKGAGPADDPDAGKFVIPEPEEFSVPCERKRRVLVRLRRIESCRPAGTAAPAAGGGGGATAAVTSAGVTALPELCNPGEFPGDLSEPLPLWVRKKSLNEFGSDRERFPMSCTVFIDGDCAGSGSNQRPSPVLALETLPVTTAIDLNPEMRISSVSENYLPAAQTNDHVSCIKLARTNSLSFPIPCHELKRSHQAMTYLVDFRLDLLSLFNTYRHSALKSPAKRNASIRPGTKQSAPSTAGRISVDVQVLSVHRMFDGKEIVTSKLQLVLVVTDASLRKLTKKVTKLLKDSNSDETQPNPTHNPEISPSVIAAVEGLDMEWSDCLWELRLVTTPTIESSNGGEESEGVGGLQIQVPSVSSVVCARWREPSLLCAQWQSVALTLKSPPDAGTDSYSDLSPTSPSDHSVVDIAVNGEGRIKITGAEGGSTVESQDGALLAWLPPNPRLLSRRCPSRGEYGEEDVEQSMEEEKKHENPDFSILVRIGGYAAFVGFIKNIAVCSGGDRCNPSEMTECFASWRRESHSTETLHRKPSVSEDGAGSPVSGGGGLRRLNSLSPRSPQRGGDQDLVDSPSKTSVGDEVTSKVADISSVHIEVEAAAVTLLCGSADFNRLIIPAETPEGLYVLEISDGVHESCLVDSLSSSFVRSANHADGAGADELPARLTESIKDSARVIISLQKNYQIMFKVVHASVPP